jgi:uncharacterized membrane protein HdeD (DUF308 family)
MTNASTGSGNAIPVAGGNMSAHWRLFVIEGAILTFLGAAAILVPQVATLAVEVLLGWVFLIGGILGLATTVIARQAPGFWWALISSAVSIVAGAFLLRSPIGGAISLTLILTCFLIADGILMVLFGMEHRRQLSRQWGWFVANGVLDLILAAIIIVALPGSVVWVLGLLIGIDLLFGGSSLIAIGFAYRPK